MNRPKSQIRLPGPSNRTTVIGRTGSGKSQFATWLLSTQNFDAMPWVIIDFKDEQTDIINRIDNVVLIDYDVIPEHPGIYMLKPRSGEVKNELSEWLDEVLIHGDIGLFFDEVFPMGQYNESFNTILMQGRSKNVPIICCTQRPSNVSTYCFSEASYCMIFDLSRVGDRKRVHEEFAFIPRNYELPEYHSYYYDVARKYDDKLGPAPDRKKILSLIKAKMPEPPRRTL
jgi:hypothetical protein